MLPENKTNDIESKSRYLCNRTVVVLTPKMNPHKKTFHIIASMEIHHNDPVADWSKKTLALCSQQLGFNWLSRIDAFNCQFIGTEMKMTGELKYRE